MIVVVDIETTGLDPRFDSILEVGCIIMDDSLEHELAGFMSVVGHPNLSKTLKDNQFVYDMHVESGLLDLCENSPNALGYVEKQFVDFLVAENAVNEPMCGSSIHFDRAFLKEHMPAVEDLFHYRNIDVSTLKNVCEKWAPDVFEKRPTGNKLHRALSDCEDTIAELKFYKDALFFSK